MRFPALEIMPIRLMICAYNNENPFRKGQVKGKSECRITATRILYEILI